MNTVGHAPGNTVRLLFLTDSYLPDRKAGAKLIHDLASEVARQGHSAVVAAPSQGLSQPVEKTSADGMTVLRVRTRRIKAGSRVARALREWRLAGIMYRAGRDFFRRTPCQLIVTYSPTIFFGPLVRKLKRMWGCRSYLILRDIFPQWAVDLGLLREGSLPCRFFRRAERIQYRHSDLIAVQSPANLDYFRNTPPPGRPQLDVLYNWALSPDAALTPPPTCDQNDRCVFFYGGNLGVGQDMESIVRLAEGLRKDPNASILIVGAGSKVTRLQTRIREEALTNIKVRPSVDQNRYLQMLSDADVGLVTLDQRHTTHNFPGKTLGYMHHGIPILASLNPGNDLGNVLSTAHAGFSSITGQYDCLLRNALRLSGDPSLRREMGLNGKSLLKDLFSVETAARQVLRFALTGEPTLNIG